MRLSRRTVVVVVLGALVIGACAQPRDVFGPGIEVDFAVFIEESATDDEVAEVRSLLEVPRGGTSFDSIDGVRTVVSQYSDPPLYVPVLYIQLFPGVSADRSDEILGILRSHPLVVRVETDYLVPGRE